jgi:hypothetical protein
VSAALLRFWWVVAVGVVVGVALAVVMVYNVPEFTSREQPEYTATARLFVTSSEGQYLRLSVPRSVDTGSTEGNQGTNGAGGGPAVLNMPPDYEPLLAAANMYPVLIESDEVSNLRTSMFGELEGTVSANAYSAVSTPQRYSPAQIPVIDIFATSATGAGAITLADKTAAAFKRFILNEQNRAKLSPAERIQIQSLRAPRDVYVVGGASYGIPMLIALAVIAAFCMLAVVLDQLFPLRVQALQQPPPQQHAGTS